MNTGAFPVTHGKFFIVALVRGFMTFIGFIDCQRRVTSLQNWKVWSDWKTQPGFCFVFSYIYFAPKLCLRTEIILVMLIIVKRTLSSLQKTSTFWPVYSCVSSKHNDSEDYFPLCTGPHSLCLLSITSFALSVCTLHSDSFCLWKYL